MDLFMKSSVLFCCLILSACSLPTEILEFENKTKSEEKLVICNFNSWSLQRSGNSRFDISKIDATLCTHVVYSYIGLSFNGLRKPTLNETIQFSVLDGNYSIFTKLKLRNPGLKTLASVGGYAHSLPIFSKISRTERRRSEFIRRAISFLTRFGFDGLNLDWDYPMTSSKRNYRRDKLNFVLLLKELRSEFEKKSLIVSVSVSGFSDKMEQVYDVYNISENADIVMIKAYTYPLSNRKNCFGSNSPLRDGSQNTFGLPACDPRYNAEYSVNYWLDRGALADKLVLGMAAFGRMTYKNLNGVRNHTTPNSTVTLPSRSVNMAYGDICHNIKGSLWNVHFDETEKVPLAESQTYPYKLSYENERSITEKGKFILVNGLAGGMLDSVDTDDFNGRCATGRYPLLKALRRSLNENEIEV